MLSIPHLIIIFIVALVVFGPQKLPELARTLGKVMAEFRRATGDLRMTFEDQMRELERESQALEKKKRDLEAMERAKLAGVEPAPPVNDAPAFEAETGEIAAVPRQTAAIAVTMMPPGVSDNSESGSIPTTATATEPAAQSEAQRDSEPTTNADQRPA